MLIARIRGRRPGIGPRRARAGLPGLLLVIAPMFMALLVTGCQSQAAANREPYDGASTAAAGSDQQVVLTVGRDFRFSPSTITVHPGKVTITLRYDGTSGPPHDWQLTGFPTDYVPLTSSGQTHSTTFVAPAPGSYSFICTIHVRQGQKGTLVVLPS